MDIISITPSPMRWSLESEALGRYTARQLGLFSTDSSGVEFSRLAPYLKESLARVERCFTSIRRKYYFDGHNTLFSHRHADHYAIYLYYLSNTVHREGRDQELAEQLFLLNKCLHGADLFYAVTLPDVFLLIHPVGTVLGSATYGNYFVAYQNCGVGSLEDGRYPVFDGENVLFARSAVLGNCHIGMNVICGANSFLLNTDVPSDHTVVGAFPQHSVLPTNGSVVERLFR